MDPKIQRFLQDHQVSCLAVLLKNGFPHASTLHYSHKDKPLELYFSTENTSRKCQTLLKGNSSKASVVVGFSEEEWKTLQMDGEVEAVFDKEELKNIQTIHYLKHPNSEKYKNDPETIFLKFMPKWWRYTDYNANHPIIISSEKYKPFI